MIQKQKYSGTPKKTSGTMTEMHSISLTKKAELLIIILTVISFLLIPLISALSITEVELNPEGKDSGNEWIGIYSENLTNFTNLEIITNTNSRIINGTLFLQGYCIMTFSSQFLDNNDEAITLKLENQILDQTINFTDISNNNLTWQYDSNLSNWTFTEQAFPLSENCTVITFSLQNTTNQTNQTAQNTTTNDIDYTDDNTTTADNTSYFIPTPSTNTAFKTEQNDTIKKIVLNPSPEKSEKEEIFISKKEKTYLFLLISFTFLTVVIIILLALRKL